MCSFLRLEEMWRGLRFWRFFPDVHVGPYGPSLRSGFRLASPRAPIRDGVRKASRSAKVPSADGTSGMGRFFKDSIHPHVDQYRKSRVLMIVTRI